jgi:hypothetical protein
MKGDENKMTDLTHFQNKKYGNLASSERGENVRVGHLVFSAPSLKASKKVHRKPNN